MREAEIGVMVFEDGGRGHKPKEAKSRRRQGNKFSPQSFWKEAAMLPPSP